MGKGKGAGSCPITIPLPIVLFREGKWIVAHCPIIDVASQGKTSEEAKKNIEEAIDLYMEDKDTVKPNLKELDVTISTVCIKMEQTKEHGGHLHEAACPVGS